MDEVQNIKRALKKWELSFYKEKGRKPQKGDIADEAPPEIKEAYAKYYKLKREQSEDNAVSEGTQYRNETEDRETSKDKTQKCDSFSCSSEKIDSGNVHLRRSKRENVTNNELHGSTEVDSEQAKGQSEVWGREFDKKIVGNDVQQDRFEEKLKDVSSNFLQGLSSKLYKNSLKFGGKESKGRTEKKGVGWRNIKKPVDEVKETDQSEENNLGSENLKVKGSIFEKAFNISQKKRAFKVSGDDEVGVTEKYSLKPKSKFSFSVGQKVMSASTSADDIDEVDSVDTYPLKSSTVIEDGKYLDENYTHHKASFQNLPVDSVSINPEMTVGRKDGIKLPIPPETDESKPELGDRCHTDSIGDKLDKPTPVKSRGKRLSRVKDTDREDSLERGDIVRCQSEVAESQNSVNKLTTLKSKATRFSEMEKSVDKSSVDSANNRLNTVNFHPFDFDEIDDEIKDDKNEEDDDDDPVRQKQTRKRKMKNEGENPKKKKKIEEDMNVGAASGASDEETGSAKTSKISRGKSTAAPASVGNFVKLNMKIKTYKRKGRGMTGQQYKRFQWKQKMKARSKSFGNKCFKCGQEGHWSNKCPEQNKETYGGAEDKPPVLEEDFPTMKEAALMARGIKQTNSAPPKVAKSKPAESAKISEEGTELQGEKESLEDINWDDDMDMDSDVDEDLEIQSSIVRSRKEEQVAPTPLSPLVDRSEDNDSKKIAGLLKQGLKKFGYDSFRLGQEKAITRILQGKSTLVVMSTGGGKSLCYQLPAYLYAQRSKVITLVISPLVSLMEDQVTGLPPGVKGACLHTNMTPAQREGVLASVREGRVHFLLVSPEAVAGGGMTLLNNKANLPPIAFVCIDEAHCLSEWSHNFRPSYLRLTKVLREKFGVQCFLGLTATATLSTAVDVAKHLEIEDFEEAVIRGPPVPNNLLLSVSRDDDRDQALIGLLKGDRFSNCESIIVYCTRREQTERLATLIRTCLKDERGLDSWDEEQKRRQKGRKKKYAFWDAESYHAGLTPAQRKKVQNAFMSGRLRVVVATVAFGMGLDKPDVRGIIHYNMPKSFEGYVQEIGRAGRDGKDSQCHLFLDPQGQDLAELKRHTYSNTVDYKTLKRFLQRIFTPCHCKQVHQMQNEEGRKDEENGVGVDSIKRICTGHERALSIESSVMELDVKEEGLSTLLCYLELHPNRWLENLVNVYSMCKIQCYGGPAQLQAVAKKCPPVAVAIAKAKKDGKTFSTSNSIEFPVIEISDCMGWDSGPVKRELKLLSWTFSKDGSVGPRRSGVMVEFSDLAFHFRSPGDLTDDEHDDVLQFLHDRIQKQEKEELQQLGYLFQSLRSVSHKNYWMCSDDLDLTKNEKLKGILRDYFMDQKLWDKSAIVIESEVSSQELGQAVADIRQLISVHGHEHRFTGRAVARIFHGIGSPCFPATTWGRNRRFWRAHMNVDFNVLIKLATQELIRFR